VTRVPRRSFVKALAGSSAALLWEPQVEGADNAPHGDLHDGTYLNPILGGDHPDAGAIRVGQDYYLTHSSMDFSPGLSIWHSRDLVSWKLVNYGLRRYFGNVWAPYLCEYRGHFYIYYPCDGQLYVIHADSPAAAWSEPVPLHIQGIDPAHIADPAGNRFLHFSGGRMVQLSADGLSVKGSPRRVFQPWPIPKDWVVECECLEAPKLTFRNSYYYLTVAEGGTAGPPTSHMVVSARSRNVDGPWEYSPFNPIVHTASGEERWWSQGHGRLVDATDGSWWMTYHAYQNGYRSMGRQTLLVPVEWTADGWFRVPEGVHPDRPIHKPKGKSVGEDSFSDGFSGPALGPHWQGWRAQEDVTVGNGRLILHPIGREFSNGAFLTLIAPDPWYEVEVELETEGGCEAGLVLFYDSDHSLGLSLAADGIGLRRPFQGSPRTPLHIAAARTGLRLVNRSQVVEAFYRTKADGPWEKAPRAWEVAGLNHNVLGAFRSLRPALYACAAGTATFRNFHYTKL
jgi:xylan 1,4-beta-xylosidase